MSENNNLASRFKRKQINEMFINNSFELVKELKPDYFIIASNAHFDQETMEEFNKTCNVILVVNDANRYLELIDSPFKVFHFTPKSKVLEDVVKDTIFNLLDDQLITPDASMIFVSSRQEEWDYLSQIQFIELEKTERNSYIRGLSQLTHIAPLDVIERIIEMAIEIGQEGREGKPVGTILVLGDHKRVLQSSRPLIFNPFKGYSMKEREIFKPEVRDAVKEIAKIDGAIIISSEGIVHAGGMYLDFSAKEIDVPTGLGSRHTSAAATSKATASLSIAISESTGIVRVFVDGAIFLQVNSRGSTNLKL